MNNKTRDMESPIEPREGRSRVISSGDRGFRHLRFGSVGRLVRRQLARQFK